MKFLIIDVTTRKNKTLETITTNKGEADRRFVELKKIYPNKKLWLKIEK